MKIIKHNLYKEGLLGITPLLGSRIINKNIILYIVSLISLVFLSTAFSCNKKYSSKFEMFYLDSGFVDSIKARNYKFDMLKSYEMCGGFNVEMLKKSKYLKSYSIYFNDGTLSYVDIYEFKSDRKDQIDVLFNSIVNDSRKNIPTFTCPIYQNSIHGYLVVDDKIFLFNSGVSRYTSSGGYWTDPFRSLDEFILLQKRGVDKLE